MYEDCIGAKPLSVILSAVTGLGKGSLYGAFGDKHALYLRVFDGYCADIAAALDRSLDGPDAGAFARLCQHVRAVAQNTASDTERRGCFLANGTAELAGRDSDVADISLRTFDILLELIATDLRGAQRCGDIDPAADADELANVVLAVLRGIEALGKAGRSRESLGAIAESAIAMLPKG